MRENVISHAELIIHKFKEISDKITVLDSLELIENFRAFGTLRMKIAPDRVNYFSLAVKKGQAVFQKISDSPNSFDV